MSQDITKLKKQLLAAIADAEDESQLEAVRLAYFGKKGVLSRRLQEIGKLSVEHRAQTGAKLNQLRQESQQLLLDKKEKLAVERWNQELESRSIDASLPARGKDYGGWHPVSQIRSRIEDIFRQAGYDTVIGPEIESDYYNFEALNFPPGHPARDMHDTFYFDDGKLLRTHTSPSQIRSMETSKPPIRIICPGKTFRCDHDATHSPMFHQVEGLVIDKAISFADLKGTLQAFVNAFFGEEVKLRFRASYFPFTEPSAEVDILRPGKRGKEWLEILGCGMVHPNVLKEGGINPDRYSGFAFGMGIERMAMLYFGIDDLRLFYENDLRFLRQFV